MDGLLQGVGKRAMTSGEGVSSRQMVLDLQELSDEVTYLPPKYAAPLAAGLGLVFVLGGPERYSSPTYATIRDLGGNVVWGVALLVAAMALWGAGHWSRRWNFYAYAFASLAYLLFGLATLDAALEFPAAGLPGIVAYFWLFWMHGLAAADRGSGRVSAWLWKRFEVAADSDTGRAVMSRTSRIARHVCHRSSG